MKRAIERRELERKLLRAMKAKRLSFRTLAAETGLSPFIVTAALLGRMSLPQEGAAKIAALLDITEARDALIEMPLGGALGREIPTDPLIDRLYEIIRLYGTTIKALIEEEFGDGIMSVNDFELDLLRQPDPNGDRVKIVMTGKFLKSKKTGMGGATVG
jgi:cyanate lyase